MTKISIIVPIYKIPETYLINCIESILAQTYKNFCLILIDDESPDNCGRICDEYAIKDNRVKVIHKKNAGVAAARNTGIELADSEWITCIDPDDWIEPNYLYEFIQMTKETDSEVLLSSCYVNYPKKQIENSFFNDFCLCSNDIGKDRFILQFICANIYKDNIGTADSGSPWAKFYKKELLDKNHIRFDESLHRMEDNKFNIEVYSKANSIYYKNLYIYHYRKSKYSGFSRFTPEITTYYESFLFFFNKYIESENKEDTFKKALYVKVMNSVYVYCKMYYFHKKNTKKISVILKELSLLLSSPLYDEASKNMDTQYLSFKEYIFFIMMKYKCPFGLYLIMTLKNIVFSLTGKGL